MLDPINRQKQSCTSDLAVPPAMNKLAKIDKYALPIVSVIVVNYNYGVFLREAVESVMAQTYPFIECVIVDDCSTDDSLSVIESLKREFDTIKVVVNARNGGQSASSLVGMENSVGAYIVFLDADDYLYPACIETHVQAHLALRMPVGFTSVDMVQIRDGRIVTAAAAGFNRFVSSKVGINPDNVRDLATRPDFPRLAIGHTPIGHLLHYVDPTRAGGWPWSPTSGNCFRREALHLITKNEHLASLRSCTDCYLLRGVACLTGSALIDLPLVAYRLHGSNDFVKSASVNRIRPYDAGYLKNKSNQATKMLVDYLVDHAGELVAQLEAPLYLKEALDALDDVHPPIIDARPGYLTRLLILNRDRLRSELGRKDYDSWLAQRCLPAWVRGIFFGFLPARFLFEVSVMPAILWATRRRMAAETTV